jgi:hypothetical protein
MLEKTVDAVVAYCFGLFELFCVFFERTHALIGLGVPLLIMIGILQYLPLWVRVGIHVFVVIPAAAGMMIMIIRGLLLSKRR